MIKVFRMTNGEDMISLIASESDMDYTVEYPMNIMMINQPNDDRPIIVLEYLYSKSVVKLDEPVKIMKNSIQNVAEPTEKFLSYYKDTVEKINSPKEMLEMTQEEEYKMILQEYQSQVIH